LVCQSWRRTICDGRVLDSAMLRARSWSRSNSFWGTSQFKPPNGTLGASSEFDQPSMIALGSSRTLDVAEPVVEGLPTNHNLSAQTITKYWLLLEICEVRRDCSYLLTGTLRRS
jgi:hypothetical protein